MDPTAAMLAFDEAYETDDRAALAEHAEALADWLAKGGAHPSPASLGWRSNMSHEQLLNFFATCKGIANMTTASEYKPPPTPKAIAYCDGCRVQFSLPPSRNRAVVPCLICKAEQPCNIRMEDPAKIRSAEVDAQIKDIMAKSGSPVAVPPSPSVPKPQKPGYYLWYILDISYFCIGAVHVTKDPPKHLDYLRGLITAGKDTTQFHMYQNDAGEWLTMYHDAPDARPGCAEDGTPYVDGYRPFDLTEFLKPQ